MERNNQQYYQQSLKEGCYENNINLQHLSNQYFQIGDKCKDYTFWSKGENNNRMLSNSSDIENYSQIININTDTNLPIVQDGYCLLSDPQKNVHLEYENQIERDFNNHQYNHNFDNEAEEDDEEEENSMENFILKIKNQPTFEFSLQEPPQAYKFVSIGYNLSLRQEQYLYGDLILEEEYCHSGEKEYNSFCNWKNVKQIEKNKNFLKLISVDKWEITENFEQAIQKCIRSQNQEMFLIGEQLQRYSQIYQSYQNKIRDLGNYISIFCKYQDLEKRNSLFQDLSDKYLAQIPEQTIFFAIKVQPNFQTNQLETTSLCFSESFLKLINTDANTLTRACLNGKMKESFGWRARLMFLKHRLNSLLLSNQNEIEEIDILSRDGLKIPVKAKKEKISFNIDELAPQLLLEPFSEKLIVYYLEVSESTQKQIQHLREKYGNSSKGLTEQIDCEYDSNQFDIQKQEEQNPDFLKYHLEGKAFLDLYYSHFNSKKSNKK